MLCGGCGKYLSITKDVDSGETIEQDVEVGQHLGVGQPRQQPCGAQQQGENDHVPDVSEISRSLRVFVEN